MTATNDDGVFWICGFIAAASDKCTINNSLSLCTIKAKSCDTFGFDTAINNCYFLNRCSTIEGTEINAEQLRSGEVAHRLQAGRKEMVWAQTIGVDDVPLLTTDATKQVYEVAFTLDNQVKATRYANSGKTVTLPTVQDILHFDYNFEALYSLSFANNFSAATAVNGNTEIAVTLVNKDAFEIASKEDWREFCYYVSEGLRTLNAKLTKDIDLGSDICMAGVGNNMYGGTFDGQGHSITVDWNTTMYAVALFRYARGANFKNLHTKGNITTNHMQGEISGMVCYARGNVTFTNCSSMTNLNATGLFAHSSGMIAHQENSPFSTFTDCVVGGKFSGSKHYWQGFVGGGFGGSKFTNCLYIGESPQSTIRSNTFVEEGMGELHNCYYLSPCGAPQGTQVTAEQLKSGEVAHWLQAGRNELAWGQTIGEDIVPLLTSDDAKQVYEVAFTLDNQVKATRYANRGKTVTLPTIQDLLHSDYNLQAIYTLSFANNFSAATAVNGNTKVAAILVNNDNALEIATKEDWKAFGRFVSEGLKTLNAKLTKDIDLGTDISMVGTEAHPYGGTFDGQGHSITVDWNTDDEIGGLFRNVEAGNIRNLHTRGSIVTSSSQGRMSGMVGKAAGHVTLTNCSSMTDLTASTNSVRSAGMVGYTTSASYIELTDCMVGGKFSGGASYRCGFVNYQAGWCVLTNCLFLGEIPDGTSGYTFVMEGKGAINNCYYRNACGMPQGTQTTEKQLKSGETVAKLGSAWAQTLGEMPGLYNEGDKAKPNYVYYDTENDAWTCNNFHLTAEAMPIGLDFTANTVSNERALARSGNYTVCLPYAMPIPATAKAYTLSSIKGKVAYFAEVTDAALQANTPYLLVASAATSLNTDDPTSVAATPTQPMEQAEGGATLVGTLKNVSNAEAAAAKAYILQGNGQWHQIIAGNETVSIPAYRAYLTLPAGAPAKALYMAFGDTTTGLRAIETTDADGTVRYYDLNGRYIGTTLDGQPRGIYIGNGKKVTKH